MKKKKFSKLKAGAAIILFVLLIGSSILIIRNQFHSHFDDLNETDQFILQEFNSYCTGTEQNDIWSGFLLNDKTILAVDSSFRTAYLINPQTEIHSIFSKKITMPSDYKIEVYRLSSISPFFFTLIFDGNFNSIEKKYELYGNDIYYTKYNNPDSITKPFSSEHYITFLSHEAFHYYMQKKWPAGSTYSTDSLSDTDCALLYQEYEILAQIQAVLSESRKDSEELLRYAKEYADTVSKRMKENPEYVKKELERETVEGTASYVGIKASEITGYDFGVMYFDNAKNVSFSKLKEDAESGLLQRDFLADRIPYETGALLCLLMDELNIPDWQQKLNNQTSENPVTLYSIIDDFIHTA